MGLYSHPNQGTRHLKTGDSPFCLYYGLGVDSEMKEA